MSESKRQFKTRATALISTVVADERRNREERRRWREERRRRLNYGLASEVRGRDGVGSK